MDQPIRLLLLSAVLSSGGGVPAALDSVRYRLPRVFVADAADRCSTGGRTVVDLLHRVTFQTAHFPSDFDHP